MANTNTHLSEIDQNKNPYVLALEVLESNGIQIRAVSTFEGNTNTTIYTPCNDSDKPFTKGEFIMDVDYMTQDQAIALSYGKKVIVMNTQLFI